MSGLQYVLIAIGSISLVAAAVLSVSRGRLQCRITIGLVCVAVASFAIVAVSDDTLLVWAWLVFALACAVSVREAAVIARRRSKKKGG